MSHDHKKTAAVDDSTGRSAQRDADVRTPDPLRVVSLAEARRISIQVSIQANREREELAARDASRWFDYKDDE
jgi:hypothetical protein